MEYTREALLQIALLRCMDQRLPLRFFALDLALDLHDVFSYLQVGWAGEAGDADGLVWWDGRRAHRASCVAGGEVVGKTRESYFT